MLHRFLIVLTLLIFAVQIFPLHAQTSPSQSSSSSLSNKVQAEATALANQKSDSVLAVVNGDPITVLDVILRTEAEERQLKNILSGENLLKEIVLLRKNMLEELISQKLIYSRYKSNPPHWGISNQEIESLLDMFSKSFGVSSRKDFEKKMEKDFDYTSEQLKEYATELIAVNKMRAYECDNKVYVSPKEVYEEYLKNQKKWIKPALISLQILQIDNTQENSRKTIQEIKDVLSKDSSQQVFANVVTTYFSSPKSIPLEVATNTERDKLRDEFKKALEKATEGQTVGPIPIDGISFFLRVTSITDEKVEPFSNINKEISAQLRQKKIEEARKIYDLTLRNNAYIQYFFQ